MAFTAITDHSARALARLALQFRSSTEFAGILTALAAQVQEIENAIAVVVAQYRTPSAATADLLSKLAQLIQVPAVARPAPTSREINATILANSAQGTARNAIDIVNAAIGDLWTSSAYAVENGEVDASGFGFSGGADCTLILQYPGTTIPLGADRWRLVSSLLASAAPAGMRTIWVFVGDPAPDSYDGELYCDGFSGAVLDANFIPFAALDKPAP
jgi:hypothetical protein